MKVRSIFVPAILLTIILFNSCKESPVNGISNGTDLQIQTRGNYNYSITDVTVKVNGNDYTPDANGWSYPRGVNYPYDILIKGIHSGYEILYKDVNVSGGILELPLYAVMGLADYNITVHLPSVLTGQKGKLIFMDPDKSIVANQDIENSSILHFSAPPDIFSSGSIILLTYTKDSNGHINHYTYFTQKYLGNISAGNTDVTINESDLAAVNEFIINCSVNVPAGCTFLRSDFTENFIYNRRMSEGPGNFALDSYITNNFQVVIPTNIITYTHYPLLYVTTVAANGVTQQTFKLPEYSTTLDVTPAPKILSPGNNAINVDTSTIFSFEKQSTSNVVIFTLNDSIGGMCYNLCTTESNIKLSMLSSMVNILPNRRYSFSVEQVGVYGCQNVGEYINQSTYLSDYKGTTLNRYFTTKP
jgi:hypothetical protein